MKTMTMNLMALISILSLSSAAMADENDLKLFDAVLAAPVETESGTSKTYVSATDVVCANEPLSQAYECKLKDGIGDGSGPVLELKGADAKALSEALDAYVEPIVKHGVIYQFAASVVCKQTSAGVYEPEISEADRTHCNVTAIAR